ncbi:MAG: sigma-54-dependent Fis family transcriptional regulator, partial [Lentisphaeraceae bacterium]|nr:sigma-54-dependent Fis family transcriptional regulator [Lentisphaeraceae bacterium]
ANIPEKLFESELFGVSRGAYSGASMDMKGKVISADGGTLFLDEISEMPINAQAKFLQFLEEGFFYPLGSTTQLNPDVRIIVDANFDFIACIADKTFREDLYYRISNFPIHLPPLRHRSEDVFALAKFFINKYCEKYLLPVCELDPATLSKLSQHNWPGNIREFENCIQQGLVKAKIDGITVIKPEHILAGIVQAGEKEVAYDGSFQEQKSKWEKIFISAQLNVHDWNVSRTAVALEMSRSHLNKLIKLYELERR